MNFQVTMLQAIANNVQVLRIRFAGVLKVSIEEILGKPEQTTQGPVRQRNQLRTYMALLKNEWAMR